MSNTLYMVIERFKGGDPLPVYRRFRDRGRQAPEGLSYICSWVDENLTCCYQVMEAADRSLLDRWIARWSDLVDFEVHPVIASAEAAARVLGGASKDGDDPTPPPVAAPSRRCTGRPLPGEYADYAAADVAAVPGDDAIDALAMLAEQTPALFGSLANAAEQGLTYADGKWTLKGIVGHLIDDERIFAYRVLCVARGEERELAGFDENQYAAAAASDGRSLDDLLAEYSASRGATLALLRGLPEAAWMRRGRVNGYGCSVRGLAFHIAAHELHHHRIVRDRYLPLLG
jgi:hypothetical protein